MPWDNILATLAVVLILGGAIFYIVRSKKKGVKCIGCPDGAKCAGKCSGCSGNCSGCNDNHQA